MSTPTAPAQSVPAPPPRQISPSMIALSVLAVVVLATTPGLPAFIGWALHQPWITIPALLLAAAWTWRPKATKRVLLTGVLLAHQAWTRRRQAKTATA